MNPAIAGWGTHHEGGPGTDPGDAGTVHKLTLLNLLYSRDRAACWLYLQSVTVQVFVFYFKYLCLFFKNNSILCLFYQLKNDFQPEGNGVILTSKSMTLGIKSRFLRKV